MLASSCARTNEMNERDERTIERERLSNTHERATNDDFERAFAIAIDANDHEQLRRRRRPPKVRADRFILKAAANRSASARSRHAGARAARVA